MPFHEAGRLRYFTFDIFQTNDLVQKIFSRHGGTSPKPWASLNVGGTTGDDQIHVVENRKRIFAVCDLPVDSIYDPWQVHGTQIICVDKPRPLANQHEKGDAILTNRTGITLFMRFADCVPIVLYDPVNRVIGMVHAGWRGTVSGIALSAVRKMISQYNCSTSSILAGIGPSICVEHYQVGEDVVTAVKKAFQEDWKEVLWEKNGFSHFNLWIANHLMLEKSGITKIEHSNACTFENTTDWYSHRAEGGVTGRFAAIMALL